MGGLYNKRKRERKRIKTIRKDLLEGGLLFERIGAERIALLLAAAAQPSRGVSRYRELRKVNAK